MAMHLVFLSGLIIVHPGMKARRVENVLASFLPMCQLNHVEDLDRHSGTSLSVKNFPENRKLPALLQASSASVPLHRSPPVSSFCFSCFFFRYLVSLAHFLIIDNAIFFATMEGK
jgi:hypothetical protein